MKKKKNEESQVQNPEVMSEEEAKEQVVASEMIETNIKVEAQESAVKSEPKKAPNSQHNKFSKFNSQGSEK